MDLKELIFLGACAQLPTIDLFNLSVQNEKAHETARVAVNRAIEVWDKVCEEKI